MRTPYQSSEINMQQLLQQPVEALSDTQLSQIAEFLNEQYRSGTPEVSDNVYDFVYLAALKQRMPQHELLVKVQNEGAMIGSKGRVIHPSPMLSTDKAYTEKEVEKWLLRVIKAGQSLGIPANEIIIECSSKLDGIAARRDYKTGQLFSRGDGLQGEDITHIASNGLVITGKADKHCVGEVVMKKIHFDTHFSKDALGEMGFANSRGFIAGIANSDEIKPHAKKALDNGYVELVVYEDMPRSACAADTFMANLEALENKHLISPYLLDGVIFDVVDSRIKALLGFTSHHPVWRLAKKRVNDVKETVVNNIRWQVGRTRVISPVLEVDSVKLADANVTSITAHSLGYLVEHGLGVGSRLTAKRSGEVIPAHEKTISRVEPIIPDVCPCCESSVLIRQGVGEYHKVLMCSNDTCGGSVVSYFFHAMKRLGVDLFGRKACEKLVDNGIVTIEQILVMSESDYLACGFGAGQSANFIAEIARAKADTLKDTDMLASLGIHLLGRGTSEKILKHYKITELSQVTYEELLSLDGIAEISAKTIIHGLAEKSLVLSFLLAQHFTLSHTSELKEGVVEGNGLSGLNVVFTGTMVQRNRDEMKSDAKLKNAKVQGSVNSKTNLLIIGDKVGQSKINKANELGVEIITEEQYNKRFG